MTFEIIVYNQYNDVIHYFTNQAKNEKAIRKLNRELFENYEKLNYKISISEVSKCYQKIMT